MEKTYTVAGPHEVVGHQPGETFTGPLPEGLDEESLLASGALTVSESKEKTPCPACKAEGKKRPASFKNLDELQAHYRDKHPALMPPEKEEGDG